MDKNTATMVTELTNPVSRDEGEVDLTPDGTPIDIIEQISTTDATEVDIDKMIASLGDADITAIGESYEESDD